MKYAIYITQTYISSNRIELEADSYEEALQEVQSMDEIEILEESNMDWKPKQTLFEYERVEL